ncbi:MAG TPA: hypothetical protein VN681_08400 [Stellaceae bacterium]|nr:hypothetical protein [Stellaceae bacterium]
MPSSLRERSPYLALGAAGLAYPFLVYFGLRVVPPAVIAGGLVGILGVRLALDRGNDERRRFAPLLFGAAVGTLILVVLSPRAGLKSYPILVSLAFAGLFAYSLWRPPTIIERIARLHQPDLPPAATPYMRNVTRVWLGYFLANAAISAATAMSGDLDLWMLYNGLISYILMGVLFAVEFMVRRHVRRRGGAA